MHYFSKGDTIGDRNEQPAMSNSCGTLHLLLTVINIAPTIIKIQEIKDITWIHGIYKELSSAQQDGNVIG